MRITTSLLVWATLAWSQSPIDAQERSAGPSAQADPAVAAAVGTYCAGCHNGRMQSPTGMVLDQFDAAHIAENPDLWARAYRQLQAGTMPPVGAPRPDRVASDAVLSSIEKSLGGREALPVADSQLIATRLATMLWNSAPDAALLEAARRNALADPPTLERQVRRMLADDRAQAFVSRFFFRWLQLEALDKADPDRQHFPNYEVSLRDALAKETELFILSQLRDDTDPVDLWRADYTFLNEQVAAHYGVPNVTGAQFRRVSLPGPERAGLLGHGSVLMATSRHQHGVDAAYTSPATRALWVQLHFLGAPPPRPFPGAQPVKPELPITPQTRTLPVSPCVTCHRNFFPLGYALENFDPLGRWRTHDQAGPVDASGSFVDGSSTNGVIELRRVLLQRPEAFRTTVVERLLIYSATGAAAGRGGTTTQTLIQARQVLNGTPQPRWSSLIAAVVRTR
jgi:hypothetical protein